MTSDDTRPLTDDLGFESRPEDTAALRGQDTTALRVDDDAVTRPAGERAGTPRVDGPDPSPDTGTTATATATATPDVAATSPARPYGDPPVYRRGPAPFGLFLGVVGLAVALAVVLTELADVDVPWSDLGPWVVVAGGLLVVLMGLLGLRSSRTED